ncbi:MAG TPA: SigE family RNA polymerase sigma factor [Acidimicrobiia bacterium]
MSDPVVRAARDFGQFYRSEYRAVLGLAFALCRDRGVAEELVQEGFTAAFRRWDEVGRMDHPGAWVRRVVTNHAVSRFRRLGAEARALVRARRAQSAPALSPDAVAVWDAIRALPARQAEVVVLAYFADLSHGDIADVLGCAVETVRSHLKRGRARLGALLGEES